MFNNKLTFITAQSDPREPVPTTPGTPYGGGYYAGRIMVDGVEYALVVAPKTQGGQSPRKLQWKTSTVGTLRTSSWNDGWANTQGMIATGIHRHPAANFCTSLEINGYTDWYLPARNELEILYRAFKPTTTTNNTSYGTNTNSIPPRANYTRSDPQQTSLEIFKVGGSEAFLAEYYWTSTTALDQNAWIQSFSDGGQYNNSSRTNSIRVRAVRRVAV